MPKGRNQKIKLLYIMKILLENTDEEHGVTLNEIAKRLNELGVDAERKTLYDDIETLRGFGLDIDKRKNREVTYHILSRQFEIAELKLLIDAVQSSNFISERKSNELIKKLSSTLSRFDSNKLQRQVYVSNRIKSMNESIYYSVDYIHEAISSNRKVAFFYFEWNSKKEKTLRRNGKRYTVSPHALAWEDENYYLIGYEEGKIKHFRVDKMSKIEILDIERDGEEVFSDFDMGVYSKKTFGMYGGREESVTLRCKNSLAGVIIDRFGLNTPFLKADDEHFEVSVKVYISPIFLSWVVGFGEDIKIISPDSVKKELVNLIKSAQKQYE